MRTEMIGIVGTLVLLPLALVALLFGFVRFAVKLAAALVVEGFTRLSHTG